MKKIFFIIVMIACSSFAIAQRTKPHSSKSKAISKVVQSSVPLRAVIAAVQLSSNIPAAIEYKLDAAFGLACFASGKYTAISFAARDSAARMVESQGKEPTALTVARELKADRLLLVQVSRIENILRVQVASAKGENFAQVTRSEGYSLLRFHQNDSTILYDPSLLEALQRAFSAAEGDSMMFANADKDMRVFPAPPLAIIGIEFIDSVKTLSKIFDIKQQPVNGYDAALTIFQTAKSSNTFTAFDIDTRDTIYAIEQLEYVENNKPASVVELKILYKYGITHCIVGSLIRSEKGTILTLQLCNLSSNGTLTKIRSQRGIITDDDSIAELRLMLTRLTKKILKIED